MAATKTPTRKAAQKPQESDGEVVVLIPTPSPLDRVLEMLGAVQASTSGDVVVAVQDGTKQIAAVVLPRVTDDDQDQGQGEPIPSSP